MEKRQLFAKSWLKKIEEYILVAGVSAVVDTAGLIGPGQNLLSEGYVCKVVVKLASTGIATRQSAKVPPQSPRCPP